MRPFDSYEQAQARITALAADSGLTPLETGILRTVAYADVFDFPLTAAEIHRYLIGIAATQTEVNAALHDGPLIPAHLEHHGIFYVLPTRDALINLRAQRHQSAEALWPVARKYAQIIARLPFVRMIAITGALAVDNPKDADDIDYLIITESGRLWLCRALVIGVVKLAQRRGDVLCPNFFLSERALHIGDQDLFSAHELAQMIPVAGDESYQRMMQANRWMLDYLPNTNGQAHRFEMLPVDQSVVKSLLEALMRTPLGAVIEGWEMRRKIAKLSQRLGDVQTHEVVFSADRCQGHFDRHGEQTMSAYFLRLTQMDADNAG
jgi:hypothetical protein